MYIRSYNTPGRKGRPFAGGVSGLSDGAGKEPGLAPVVINQLTDLVFFARFPKLKGRGIKGFEQEWNRIKKQLAFPAPPVRSTGFIVDLTVPKDNPAPDFRKTADELGVYEAAIFKSNPPFKFSTKELVMPDGKTGSYVSSLSVSFDNPRFLVFIAKDLLDHSHDPNKDTGDRNNWKRTLRLIQEHAFGHLSIYRRVAQNLERVLQPLFHQLLALPTAKKPIPVAKKELDEYMVHLGEFITAILNREFWEKTCGWEEKDYPVLSHKIRKVGAMGISPAGLVVKCGSKPGLPGIPLPPLPLKAR